MLYHKTQTAFPYLKMRTPQKRNAKLTIKTVCGYVETYAQMYVIASRARPFCAHSSTSFARRSATSPCRTRSPRPRYFWKNEKSTSTYFSHSPVVSSRICVYSIFGSRGTDIGLKNISTYCKSAQVHSIFVFMILWFHWEARFYTFFKRYISAKTKISGSKHRSANWNPSSIV